MDNQKNLSPFNRAFLAHAEALDPFVQFGLDPNESLPGWARQKWGQLNLKEHHGYDYSSTGTETPGA